MSSLRMSGVWCIGASLLCSSAAPAHAHFKLLKPTSWVMEDSAGGPQKGGPCGPGGGDDVQPVPLSNEITTAHAGDTISVDIQETVYHPGYFRVALAENRADFKDPPLTDPTSCSFELDSVPTTPHDNVLVDGIAKTDVSFGANRHLMQDVKLPNTPCDKCTLQIVQVMKDHGPPNCFYYHCADIKILAAAGTAGAAGSAAGSGAGASAAGSGGAGSGGAGSNAGAGSGGNAAAGSSAGSAAVSGTGGQASAGTASDAAGQVAAPASSGGTTGSAPAGSSGGCAISPGSGHARTTMWLGVGGLALVFWSRRRR